MSQPSAGRQSCLRSGRCEIRTRIPSERKTGLADRPGNPYPATFRMFLSLQWTHRESNPDCRHARAVSFLWTMSPFATVDRMGIEPNAPTLQESVAPMEHASPFVNYRLRPSSFLIGRRSRLLVRPGIEPGLPPYHSGGPPFGRCPPEHLQTMYQMTPDGVEPSSPACHAGVVAVGPRDRLSQVVEVQRAAIRLWPHSKLDSQHSTGMTEVGVEPTKSPRPQRDRFSCLRTRSLRTNCQMAGPGVAPGGRSL